MSGGRPGLTQVVVRRAAALADRLRPPADGPVVLIYHRVGGRTASNIDLPAERFEEQVAELAAAGRLVSLDQAIDLVTAGPAAAPDAGGRPVVLTFDDGTADWPELVLPVLERHRAPATFYVATDYVERRQPFSPGAEPVTWDGLRAMAASGLATIGSHTHTHALLDRADAALAARELDRSVELLGEHLGAAPAHFAYPKALLGSTPAQAEVRARFRSAVVAGSRPNRPGATDPHRIARTPVQVTDGMAWFRRKADGGMHLEDRARSLLNRRRYAGATT